MKISIKALLTALVLASFAGLMPQGLASAQLFTNLHNFSIISGSPYTNYDGGSPVAGLIVSGNTLFGTTTKGGRTGNGTVFRLNTDGSAFTNLYSFTNGTDGAQPQASLILASNTLYGTTYYGGTGGYGTVFKLNTDGSRFTNLYSFTTKHSNTNNDGANPYAGLTLVGGTLYGTTVYGGWYNAGTVFAVGTNGLGFTNLHNFTVLVGDTNSDGANPYVSLTLVGGTLYGLTYSGGYYGAGTMFTVGTNSGTPFTNIFSFNGSDGTGPIGSLLYSGGLLYGTTYSGGARNVGTVFAISTNGTGIMSLHVFSAGDGSGPYGGLVLASNTLYGTTSGGGTWTNGTVFAVNTDSSGFKVMYSFAAHDPVSYTNSDGFQPFDGLVLSGDMLYGTANLGGYYDNGTVFGVVIPPTLAISLSGTNVILTWPTNAVGFALQSTTNLVPPATWSPVAGQTPVTNPVTTMQKFFRLSR